RFNAATTLNVNHGISIQNVTATFDTQGLNVTAAGQITGVGMLNKAGSGTLTLSGANTYSGGTSVSAGTLAISSDANLGAASSSLNFTNNASTLLFGAPVTLNANRGILIQSVSATFDTQGFNVTLAGQVSGAGSLNK